MRKQITINIIVALIVFLLMFTFNRKPVIVEYNQQPIIDSLIKDKKLTITKDSLFLDSIEKSYISKIKNLNYLRNNERNKYQQQISKYNNISDSTSFVYINDSIRKVCCPNHSN